MENLQNIQEIQKIRHLCISHKNKMPKQKRMELFIIIKIKIYPRV